MCVHSPTEKEPYSTASTSISSDTALLLLPKHSFAFWWEKKKTAILFECCYLTSDRSKSSRLSAWQTNGLVDNEMSLEWPGAATFGAWRERGRKGDRIHIVFDVLGEIMGMDVVIKARSVKMPGWRTAPLECRRQCKRLRNGMFWICSHYSCSCAKELCLLRWCFRHLFCPQ